MRICSFVDSDFMAMWRKSNYQAYKLNVYTFCVYVFICISSVSKKVKISNKVEITNVYI